jgi:hypothetical protein
MDDPASGLVGDRAYWVSGIEARTRALGTIDVTSGGFGLGRGSGPAATTENGSLAADGITLGTGYDQPDRHNTAPVNLYTREYRHPGPPSPETATDTLTITATNIRSVTIDPQRARVSCRAKLDVKSDGPLSVTLLGCGGQPQAFG